ncbi:hypothetical protein EST38_g3193 [Candolleomyces aberdarensis]|uniref:Uncharacterized protein n=1 Tax=Candolleomyces aberdarensis TaxID=2316362 RepID=A0A4Q2DR63_9AGAR|nr:hypothetical protein EST38_g3193 [Candolleomyces aberdarensis]
MNRGRSRQVSQTAIARNASRERRTSFLRPSPSTSPDSDDSMPYDDDPTQSLEDQVHVAYAHDDIHTAKILLLRLKGIHVTDDNDPRIAEVQDEDFDLCFAPHGTLVLDEYYEKSIREQQRLETERVEQYRRIERLRMCEQKWAREKRRLREERMQVLRSREVKRFEEEERRRRREQEQKIRRQQTEARLFQLRTTRVKGERRVLSYTLQQPHSRRPPQNSSDSDSDEERASFLYDFMIVPPAPRPRRQKPSSPPPPPAKSNQRHHLPTPTFDDSCSVSFTEAELVAVLCKQCISIIGGYITFDIALSPIKLVQDHYIDIQSFSPRFMALYSPHIATAIHQEAD